MPAYYFDMEGYKIGEKADPAVDKLITIQYQKMDLTTGEPLGELEILREWESSEKEVITSFYNEFLKPGIPFTTFIPVGMGLDYEFEMITAKLKKYNLPPISSYDLYFRRPRFDLKPIIILLNDGRFNGAKLENFIPAKSDGGLVKGWYEKKEYKKIERSIRDEAEGFLKLLQYLNKNKNLMGVTRKGESAYPRPLQAASTSDAKKGFTAPRKSAAPPAAKKEAQVAKRRPETASKGSSPLKAPATPTSKRLAGAVNQFRKHTPAKK